MKFWQLRFSVFKNEDQNNKRQNHSNGIGQNHGQTFFINPINQPTHNPNKKYRKCSH